MLSLDPKSIWYNWPDPAADLDFEDPPRNINNVIRIFWYLSKGVRETFKEPRVREMLERGINPFFCFNQGFCRYFDSQDLLQKHWDKNPNHCIKRMDLFKQKSDLIQIQRGRYLREKRRSLSNSSNSPLGRRSSRKPSSPYYPDYRRRYSPDYRRDWSSPASSSRRSSPDYYRYNRYRRYSSRSRSPTTMTTTTTTTKRQRTPDRPKSPPSDDRRMSSGDVTDEKPLSPITKTYPSPPSSSYHPRYNRRRRRRPRRLLSDSDEDEDEDESDSGGAEEEEEEEDFKCSRCHYDCKTNNDYVQHIKYRSEHGKCPTDYNDSDKDSPKRPKSPSTSPPPSPPKSPTPPSLPPSSPPPPPPPPATPISPPPSNDTVIIPNQFSVPPPGYNTAAGINNAGLSVLRPPPGVMMTSSLQLSKPHDENNKSVDHPETKTPSQSESLLGRLDLSMPQPEFFRKKLVVTKSTNSPKEIPKDPHTKLRDPRLAHYVADNRDPRVKRQQQQSVVVVAPDTPRDPRLEKKLPELTKEPCTPPGTPPQLRKSPKLIIMPKPVMSLPKPDHLFSDEKAEMIDIPKPQQLPLLQQQQQKQSTPRVDDSLDILVSKKEKSRNVSSWKQYKKKTKENDENKKTKQPHSPSPSPSPPPPRPIEEEATETPKSPEEQKEMIENEKKTEKSRKMVRKRRRKQLSSFSSSSSCSSSQVFDLLDESFLKEVKKDEKEEALIIDGKDGANVNNCPSCYKALDPFKGKYSLNIVTFDVSVICLECNKDIVIKNSFSEKSRRNFFQILQKS